MLKIVLIHSIIFEQLTAMGFDSTQSCAVLHHFRGDVEKCVEELVKMGGVVPGEWLEELPTKSTGKTEITFNKI